MLHRLFAARGPNRAARFAGIFVLAIVFLAAASLVNTPSTEAAKGGNGNGNCPTCKKTTPTPTPTPTLSAPVFTAQTPPTTATVGTAYSYTFRASGNPAPTYAVYSGWLPSGLGLNATTGLLAGTPTTAGSYSFRISATNSVGTAVTSTLTITVASSCTAPWWGSVPTSYNMTAGTWSSYTFSANGSPTPTHALYSGSIPAGMSLSSTGVVSGTPTTAGSYSFQLRASNSCGTALSPVVTMSVTTATVAPLTIQAFPYPFTFDSGQAVSYQFVATGGTQPYTFRWSTGIMPAGLTLSQSGLLSGTVLAAPNQDFTFLLGVTDAKGTTKAAMVWIHIR